MALRPVRCGATIATHFSVPPNAPQTRYRHNVLLSLDVVIERSNKDLEFRFFGANSWYPYANACTMDMMRPHTSCIMTQSILLDFARTTQSRKSTLQGSACRNGQCQRERSRYWRSGNMRMSEGTRRMLTRYPLAVKATNRSGDGHGGSDDVW